MIHLTLWSKFYVLSFVLRYIKRIKAKVDTCSQRVQNLKLQQSHGNPT